jgi:SAM-dependent methyltransferase
LAAEAPPPRRPAVCEDDSVTRDAASGGAARGPLADPILEEVRRFYEDHHEGIARSRRSRSYFYGYLTRVLKVRVPPGQRVLDVGCASGDLLAALDPAYGVGLDLSAPAVAAARRLHPGRNLRFFEGDGGDPALLARLGGPFDVVLLVNVVTHLPDVQATLEALQAVCHPRTRVLTYSYSRLWQPLLRLAELLGVKYRQPPEAWLPPEEIANMLHLAGYEVVRDDRLVVWPGYVPLLSEVLNRGVGRLPLLSALSLMYGLVARPFPPAPAPGGSGPPSTSVVIPCRNEAGHVRELVERLPELGPGSEFLFVEGHSQDETEAVIRQVIADNPSRPFRLLKQSGRGKGDAVRLGFAHARGDILLILDADMGVAPEDIRKFLDALVRGRGELINGSRLVYPMERRAMRFLNLLANKSFALLFSWVLGQQVRDTLCGTKALYRADYERIAANRSYFGDFDPFGDFDLLFGAARLNLRIVDLAIRYRERSYGETNISRFRHGLLLLRMSLFAARKLLFV